MSHFLIDNLVLRWIVTALFSVSIAGYMYVLGAQHGKWKSTVNHLLHLVMSVAMIVMAWHAGMALPTVGPMVFFLLAAVWFVFVACRLSSGIPERATNGYYAVMMAAMAWMYAVMNGRLPGQTGRSSDHTLSGWPDPEMPMEMSAPEMSGTAPGWITTVNWIAAVGFAVAALHWLHRYFAEPRTNPPARAAQLAHVVMLCQAFMAAGVTTMFGVML